MLDVNKYYELKQVPSPSWGAYPLLSLLLPQQACTSSTFKGPHVGTMSGDRLSWANPGTCLQGSLFYNISRETKQPHLGSLLLLLPS